MSLGILGAGVIHPKDLANFIPAPAWRKATRNMIMAVKSMEQALLQTPMLMEQKRSDLGLVVGTSSGEIETSAEFIITLAKTGVARPLLFQNSLHNATSGFASIHFGITGPTFSISDRERTPVEAMYLADLLLEEKACGAVIETLVEVHKVMADYMGETVMEGACTLIFGSRQMAEDLRTPFIEVDMESVAQKYLVNPAHMPLFDITQSEFYQTAMALSGKHV